MEIHIQYLLILICLLTVTECLFSATILNEENVLERDFLQTDENQNYHTISFTTDPNTVQKYLRNSKDILQNEDKKDESIKMSTNNIKVSDLNDELKIFDKTQKIPLSRLSDLSLSDDEINYQNDAQAIDSKNMDENRFYEENYAIDDVRNDEDFLNDPPMMKKVDGSFGYNRRQTPSRVMYTKEIVIKQGRIKGMVRNMHPQSGLADVDQFLGLPYAEAPVGSKRFMPPGAPPPWNGLNIAKHLPPVCPQNLPNLSKSHNTFSKGRYDQLLRILPYLKTESEDCLYLNVYVPRWDGEGPSQKYPVIVYIHGESYEWNSGNPYDGSVLASYGQVIVITLNYRLGILGFMKPGISDHTVSNFGILDQIAALQWVKENIGSFGGDSNSVTLMGHGTGAACINLLMVSPVAKGLFHRSILMSGSAMSDWATTNHSLQLTMQIADGMNCPLDDANDEMLSCLRKKRYQELLKIPTSYPQFSTPFGPIVDGLVIPNQPYKVMGQYTDLFSRYDLLFGVTEVESYHVLNAMALEDGLRESERDNLLRIYMQNRFEIRPDLALAATIKKYTDIYNNPIKASSHEHRDVVLDILSDAKVVAPLLQTGIYHAKVNPRSYMYVFGHNSEAGAYANLPHSITSEELAFVFGAPLAPAGPFHTRYSTQERLLSEAVMVYWSNFAKTGNPKAPWRDRFINLHPMEWERYDIDWPEFNSRNQSYVNIGIPPSIGFRYRNIYMNYWNKELPTELNQIASIQQPPPFGTFLTPHPPHIPRGGTSVDPIDIIAGHMNRYPIKNPLRPTEDPLRILKHLLKDSHDTTDLNNVQPTFGSTDGTKNSIQNDDEEHEVVRSESTVHILVGVVVLFLVLNILIVSLYLIKKKKKNNAIIRKLGIFSYDGATDDELKRTKNNDGDDSYILDMVRKSNSFKATKTHSPINGFKITRQLSTSTVDTNTKVNDWISQDIMKYSPKSSKKSSPSFSVRAKSLLKRPRKISVAIDATPQARSNSVLRQEPIELTKMKSCDSQSKNIIICQEVDVDAEILTPDPMDPSPFERRGSTSSIQEYGHVIKIDHRYSRSDPVDMYYTVHGHNEKVTSFMDDSDINVTSCDNKREKCPLTHQEQLENIKRRNFPKVLPTYEENGETDILTKTIKRKSLPPQYYMVNVNQITKMPPTPPPRTISTLGRRPSLRRQSNNITTSPVMLAEDYPEEQEPEITKNTLMIGPLVPKSSESIYCTVKKKKFDNTTPSYSSMDDIKSLKPSGIKPPTQVFQGSISPPTTLNSTELETLSGMLPTKGEPKIIIKPNSSVGKSNIPRVHQQQPQEASGSRIPQFRTTSNQSTDRDKSTPESSSSDTSSSTETVKTELKQK